VLKFWSGVNTVFYSNTHECLCDQKRHALILIMMFRKCIYQSEYSFQALDEVTTILQR